MPNCWENCNEGQSWLNLQAKNQNERDEKV